MEKKEKRIYETPRLTTVTFRAERGYAVSSLAVSSAAVLSRAFFDRGVDAWGGSAVSDGSSLASWEDYGNNPWQ